MRPEIALTYLKHKGIVLKAGSLESDQIFLPYMIMDCVNSIYNRTVVKLDTRFESEKNRKEIRRSYTEFNKDFFRPFNRDEQDEIISFMDGFEEYINNQFVICKATIMDKIDFLEFEDQKIMADLLLINLLTSSALRLWRETFSNLPAIISDNVPLRKIINASAELGNWYTKKIAAGKKLKVQDIETIDDSFRILFNRMIAWIDRDKTKES